MVTYPPIFFFYFFCLTNQTKLRWLCEEVREHDAKAQRWRKQHQQTKDQLKALRQSRDAEQAVLLQRLHQQEKLLEAFSAEKKGDVLSERHGEVSSRTACRLQPHRVTLGTSQSHLVSVYHHKDLPK